MKNFCIKKEKITSKHDIVENEIIMASGAVLSEKEAIYIVSLMKEHCLLSGYEIIYNKDAAFTYIENNNLIHVSVIEVCEKLFI